MSAKGFTLIELLVVMVLMGVILAVVPMALFNVLPGVELKGAARDIAAGLRQARSLAVLGNRDVDFVVDIAARDYAIPGKGESRALPERLEIQLETAQSDLSDDDVGVISFFPDGSSTGGRVTLGWEGREYHIMVDWLTGQVSVVE
jgi:general secretion pathway protein H